jgi:hypothetical protein
LGTPRPTSTSRIRAARAYAVAAQVAGAQLVAVAAHVEDLDPRHRERGDPFLVRAVDAEPLGRDRSRILEARVPDGPFRHAQLVRDAADHFEGAEAALADAQVDMLALARGLVERNLVDAEVVGGPPQDPARAGQVRRQVREFHNHRVYASSRPGSPTSGTRQD